MEYRRDLCTACAVLRDELAVAAYNNGLFSGTGDYTFEPETTMTRGMLVSVLWRLEGKPEAAASPFTDSGDSWYTKAVDYVTEKKLMNGSGASFKPTDNTSPAAMKSLVTTA